MSAKCQRSFEDIKKSLLSLPVLVIADQDMPFKVVCDANDVAIGCVLMQYDAVGADRVICYQSRQLEPAERNKGTPFHKVRAGEVRSLSVR